MNLKEFSCYQNDWKIFKNDKIEVIINVKDNSLDVYTIKRNPSLLMRVERGKIIRLNDPLVHLYLCDLKQALKLVISDKLINQIKKDKVKKLNDFWYLVPYSKKQLQSNRFAF